MLSIRQNRLNISAVAASKQTPPSPIGPYLSIILAIDSKAKTLDNIWNIRHNTIHIES